MSTRRSLRWHLKRINNSEVNADDKRSKKPNETKKLRRERRTAREALMVIKILIFI